VIWAGEEVAKFVKVKSMGQIQPNGVDLTVGEIYSFASSGGLGEQSKDLPKYKEILPDDSGYYVLKPGAYLVRYAEEIRIPKQAIGLVFPRSTLQRMGATVYTSVWDSGYEGRGVGLLVVFNPHGIKISRSARICQMIFIDARAFKEYAGSYQHEGLKKKSY